VLGVRYRSGAARVASRKGHAGSCSFCGKRRIAYPVSEVARKVNSATREYFRPVEDTAHIVEERQPQYWADGETASDLTQEIAESNLKSRRFLSLPSYNEVIEICDDFGRS
jgi:hypothetical protein